MPEYRVELRRDPNASVQSPPAAAGQRSYCEVVGFAQDINSAAAQGAALASALYGPGWSIGQVGVIDRSDDLLHAWQKNWDLNPKGIRIISEEGELVRPLSVETWDDVACSTGRVAMQRIREAIERKESQTRQDRLRLANAAGFCDPSARPATESSSSRADPNPTTPHATSNAAQDQPPPVIRNLLVVEVDDCDKARLFEFLCQLAHAHAKPSGTRN